jgi:tetrahydromethanopterin S-methyltransferase subunit G
MEKNKLPKQTRVTLRWGKIKHDLGFYKGLVMGLLLSYSLYIIYKIYMFMFKW